jgi:hypothetical protein
LRKNALTTVSLSQLRVYIITVSTVFRIFGRGEIKRDKPKKADKERERERAGMTAAKGGGRHMKE